jgi:hypothetical protein
MPTKVMEKFRRMCAVTAGGAAIFSEWSLIFFWKSLRECVLCDLDTLGSGTSKDSYMDFEGIYVPLGCVAVWLRFSGVARSHQIVV